MEKKSSLDEQVDQFFRDTAVPPGFVIRTYGEGQWIVKYERNELSQEKAAKIVSAIRDIIIYGKD